MRRRNVGTRGCVATRQEDGGWIGVYNHWDSYPTCLGKQVWDEVQKKGIEKVAIAILEYGDWREYKNGGICEYCGKRRGQPHGISGEIVPFGVNENYMPTTEPSKEIAANMAKNGYPDPDAKYHEHGQGKADLWSSKNPDPLFIEWVYVLDPNKREIEVLAGCMVNEDDDDSPFVHAHIVNINIDDPEPNWEEVEKLKYNPPKKISEKKKQKQIRDIGRKIRH